MNTNFECSYFNPPITNKTPLRTVSLIQVGQMVKSPWLEPQTQALRTITDREQARRYKGWHFPYITPGGLFSYCNDASLQRFSGAQGIDLDHVGDVDGLKRKLIADPHFVTLMAFRSPSGDGLKWFIHIGLTRCSYRQWFDAVRNYLLASDYGLSPKQVDPTVRNESRACFLCYDPDVYVNVNAMTGMTDDSLKTTSFNPLEWLTPAVKESAKTAPATDFQPTACQPLSHTEELAKAMAVTQRLIARGANIAESYADYVRLGFALANGLGSDGRNIYHTLCAHSTKYRMADCERKWQECLRKADGRTTIATFYHMARQAGVDITRK